MVSGLKYHYYWPRTFPLYLTIPLDFVGVVANVLDCNIVVSKFKLQLFYYVYCLTNNLGKGMNSHPCVKYYYYYFCPSLNNPQSLIRLILCLPSLEMDIVTSVQNLDETVCISSSTNTFMKGMNPTILFPAIGK